MSLRHFITTTLRPAVYHGHGKRPPFFEGWYFKLVDAARGQAWAVIPGVYLGEMPAQTHAFIQVLNGNRNVVEYHRFPPEAFAASNRQFDVRIGDNHFTTNTLILNLPNLQGRLTFTGTIPWPVTLPSPGVMGWYGWVPVMECYHGVVSMDHRIDGRLVHDGHIIDFSGGRGYIEKDWGRHFPRTWVWLQANHFPTPGTSLMASVARIPWIGRAFPGFIIGLWHQGVLHRFTTYTGGVLEAVNVADAEVQVVVRNRRHRLTITARRSAGATLLGPTPQGMAPFVTEMLGAAVRVVLTDLDGQVLFAEESENAGMEVEGDTSLLQP